MLYIRTTGCVTVGTFINVHVKREGALGEGPTVFSFGDDMPTYVCTVEVMDACGMEALAVLKELMFLS